jgi:hypothetical protein
MERFKPVHKGLKLPPVDFGKQIQPGSFECALCHLIDYEFDLAVLRGCYQNDGEGDPLASQAEPELEVNMGSPRT